MDDSEETLNLVVAFDEEGLTTFVEAVAYAATLGYAEGKEAGEAKGYSEGFSDGFDSATESLDEVDEIEAELSTKEDEEDGKVPTRPNITTESALKGADSIF